jgi:hypothetical protein
MFKKKKQEEVYCQVCGRDLTDIGGMLGNKTILCLPLNDSAFGCTQKYTLKCEKGYFMGDYFDAKSVQKQIRRGKLIHFGSLENSVSEQ